MRLPLLSALATLAFAACASPDGSPRWPLVAVHVDSPSGARLVPADGRWATREIDPPTTDVALPSGAWWLEDGRGGPAIAVPAFDALLGGATLHVDASPSPPGDEEFATIPAGPTALGDRLGVGQPDERPARVVTLPVYQLGRREVTNAQFAAFLSACAGTLDVDACVDLRNRKCRIAAEAEGTYTTDAPDLPVVTVSWHGARAYCAWRSRIDPEHEYRLPTEAEWEKAARGPGSHVYAYGDVYTPDSANQESGHIAPVGTFPPNAWGLFDLTGNAFEWTADTEDTDGSPRCYLRGGSFVLDGIYLRNSFRMLLRPTVRADDVGLRVLREVPPRSDRPTSTPRSQ